MRSSLNEQVLNFNTLQRGSIVTIIDHDNARQTFRVTGLMSTDSRPLVFDESDVLRTLVGDPNVNEVDRMSSQNRNFDGRIAVGCIAVLRSFDGSQMETTTAWVIGWSVSGPQEAGHE